ncbi:MAG: hypothetical protein ACLFST_04980 [Spirochaetia bacterium]
MKGTPRDQVLKRFYEFRSRDFSAAGEWLAGGHEPDLRERLWYALLFIKSGNRDLETLADRLITQSVFGPCHFSSAPLFAVLGDELKITPMGELFSSANGTPEMAVHHSVRFMQLMSAYLILPEYHPAQKILDIAKS